MSNLGAKFTKLTVKQHLTPPVSGPGYYERNIKSNPHIHINNCSNITQSSVKFYNPRPLMLINISFHITTVWNVVRYTSTPQMHCLIHVICERSLGYIMYILHTMSRHGTKSHACISSNIFIFMID